jgi:general secretion pathway protein I
MNRIMGSRRHRVVELPNSTLQLMGRSFRSGMTLLEVVIALALFFAAMSAIAEILRMGSESSVKAQLQAEASLLGESKLNEVVVGIVPLTPVQSQPFAESPRWTWSLTVEDDTTLSLKHIGLTVNHLNSGGKPDHEVKFARWMRDPLTFQQSGSSSSALDTIQSVLP